MPRPGRPIPPGGARVVAPLSVIDAAPDRMPRATRPGRRAVGRALIAAVFLAWAVVLATASPAVAASASAQPPARAAGPTAERVILIGTGGFTWSDVTREHTPYLWDLLGTGTAAALSVKSVALNTCPVDGWLSLSAGQRAAAPGPDGSAVRAATTTCPDVPAPSGGQVPGWAAYVGAADSLRFGADLGTLRAGLEQAGISPLAVGPGAGIALADADGAITRHETVDWSAAGPADVANLLANEPFVVVDVGSARDPADPAAMPADPAGQPADPALIGPIAGQVRELDRRIGTVVAAAGPQATVIVAGLSDAGSAPRLRPLVLRGPGFGPGMAYSPSTRLTGLAQSPDLTVTLLRLAGAQVPAGLGGALVEPRPASGDTETRRQALVDRDLASEKIQHLVGPFFYGLVGLQLLGYGLAWWVWRGGRRPRVLAAVRVGAIVAAAVPAASFLANLLPWWRADPAFPALVGAVALFAAGIGALALGGPWRRDVLAPVGVVAGATLVVLAGDVMTGSRLQQSSLLGLQPLVGGRFYGMGNVTFALFGSASLMLAVALAHALRRRRGAAVGSVLALAAATLIVDGSPAWGADGGGPPAYLPAIAFFVLAMLGLPLTWRRVAGVAAATVAGFLAVGFLDSLRPADEQSHLGRFYVSLGDGEAVDVVIRKAEQNLELLGGNVFSPLVPIALVLAIVLLARSDSRLSRAVGAAGIPELRAGLLTWLVMVTIGFLINDSGVAVPAVGATIVGPALVTILAGAHARRPAPPPAAEDAAERAPIPDPVS